ncbi:MAG: sulfate transporter, partial [Thermoleophilia bacterium]|nr:sulfate transporter [Thermoleophilia bacterium]
TFDWHSIAPATLRRMPRGETVVMLATVATTVATHNLALGVGVGVITAMGVFARRVSGLVTVTSELSADGSVRTYVVHGELFFASDRDLISAFDYADEARLVRIDMSRAHMWDTSAVAALDAIEARYHRHGIEVEVIGLNEHSAELRGRHGGLLPGGH